MLRIYGYDNKKLIFSDGTGGGTMLETPYAFSKEELFSLGTHRNVFVYKYANHYVVETLLCEPENHVEMKKMHPSTFKMVPMWKTFSFSRDELNDAQIIRAVIKWIDTGSDSYLIAPGDMPR